jgi:hypothetical protein
MKYLIPFILFVSFACTTAEREPASSYKSVLYIGDSQSAGHLGRFVFDHLSKSFEKKDIQVYGIGSSSPRHWGDPGTSKNGRWLCKRSGRFNSYFNIPLNEKLCSGDENKSAFHHVNRKKPDLVIFQFLGNSMGFNGSYIKKRVKQLLDEIEGQDCIFITSPPYYKDLAEKNKLRIETEKHFKDAVGERCQFVQGMSEENLSTFLLESDHYVGDKIHLSKKGASVFFEQVRPFLP